MSEERSEDVLGCVSVGRVPPVLARGRGRRKGPRVGCRMDSADFRSSARPDGVRRPLRRESRSDVKLIIRSGPKAPPSPGSEQRNVARPGRFSQVTEADAPGGQLAARARSGPSKGCRDCEGRRRVGAVPGAPRTEARGEAPSQGVSSAIEGWPDPRRASRTALAAAFTIDAADEPAPSSMGSSDRATPIPPRGRSSRGVASCPFRRNPEVVVTVHLDDYCTGREAFLLGRLRFAADARQARL